MTSWQLICGDINNDKKLHMVGKHQDKFFLVSWKGGGGGSGPYFELEQHLATIKLRTQRRLRPPPIPNKS